jgi:hypothetical protein
VIGRKVDFVTRWQVRGGHVPILVHWGVNRHTVDKSGGLNVIIPFNIQNSDTRESIFGTTPNVTEFDAEDIEITIDTWLTPGDKVILTINVTNYSYHVFQLSKMHDTVFVYNKNCVGKG